VTFALLEIVRILWFLDGDRLQGLFFKIPSNCVHRKAPNWGPRYLGEERRADPRIFHTWSKKGGPVYLWRRRGKTKNLPYLGEKSKEDPKDQPFLGEKRGEDSEDKPFWGEKRWEDPEDQPFLGEKRGKDPEDQPYLGEKRREDPEDQSFLGERKDLQGSTLLGEKRREDPEDQSYSWG
jgi:hypothetical protein